MLNMNEFNTEVVGISEFRDSKSNTRTIKHSVILSDSEKRELEDGIAEDLYRIFTGGKKVSV